jgi:cytochrome c oxidase assembly protein subunit 15
VVIVTQGGIAVTGAIVRVTASGLGCPTWPQCFPGSFTPVAVAEVPRIHQAVEFGNRMISFAVVIAAILAVLAVIRARRRTEVLVYAWLMPASTVLQAVIGGITVLTGLLWWTVAIHLLASMAMVWLAVLLYVKIGEPDEGEPTATVVPPLRWLTALSATTLAAVLVAGTLVTAAGPHAGDTSPYRTVPRLRIEITTLVHAHSSLLVAYLGLLVGLGFGLLAVHAPRPVLLRLGVLVLLVFAQAAVGTVQFFTGVPAALVAVHVAGAAACTAATAALWASMRERTEPKPVQG